MCVLPRTKMRIMRGIGVQRFFWQAIVILIRIIHKPRESNLSLYCILAHMFNLPGTAADSQSLNCRTIREMARYTFSIVTLDIPLVAKIVLCSLF